MAEPPATPAAAIVERGLDRGSWLTRAACVAAAAAAAAGAGGGMSAHSHVPALFCARQCFPDWNIIWSGESHQMKEFTIRDTSWSVHDEEDIIAEHQ